MCRRSQPPPVFDHAQVLSGTLIKCNETKWPGCYLARSTTGDVARVEGRTYICSESACDSMLGKVCLRRLRSPGIAWL